MRYISSLLTFASLLPISWATILHSRYNPSDVLVTRATSSANNTSLRILPIGDSITFGYLSSDGNGYRAHLRDLLAGNSVTYLGHILSGNMTNPNNEGYSGKLISEITENVRTNGTLSQNPNLVLILAGTNDINLDVSVDTAPDRLGALIDLVTIACPSAAVIVSYITPIWGSAEEQRVEAYNAAIPAVVEARNSTSHVLALNMTRFITRDDLGDGLHPTNAGYVLMARAWASAIKDVADRGWLNINGTRTLGIAATPSGTTETPPGSTETATSPSSSSTPTAKPENGAARLGGLGSVGLMVGGLWALGLCL